MNAGQFDWGLLFFSSTGRMPRLPFVVGIALILTVLLLFENALPELLRGLTAVIFYPGLVFVSACVLSKRLHDRGRSGWWAALVLLAFGVLWPHPHGIGALFLIVILWALVELGLMPGEEGANRFGPNPQKT